MVVLMMVAVAGPANVQAVEETESDTVLMTQEEMQPPVEGYRVTQKFSWHHSGIDLAVKIGTPVKPVRRGIIAKVEKKSWGYGNNVLVQHGPNYQTLYAHLSKIDVHEGDLVDQDTVIGLSGSTGNSTGPHLHIELRLDEKAIDPNQWLNLPELVKKVTPKKVAVIKKLAEDK